MSTLPDVRVGDPIRHEALAVFPLFSAPDGQVDYLLSDEAIGAEFAKVRFLYEAQLGIGDRCELEWFVGPHTIHGVGTFDFLHRHLNWPKP